MLKEISFIRPILIIHLVVYHAFIIYRGGGASLSVLFQIIYIGG